MKNALISPNESPIKYVSGWTLDVPAQPIYTSISNSCRVAEVVDQTFEVALPMFWFECQDDVVADQFYYNLGDNEIYPVPPSPPYPSFINNNLPPEQTLNANQTIS
tara:strand:- start:374 stop:691 length:318 start_codon:yes stop_codon:yes gene_type:complete